jgi:hypothetical protein
VFDGYLFILFFVVENTTGHLILKFFKLRENKLSPSYLSLAYHFLADIVFRKLLCSSCILSLAGHSPQAHEKMVCTLCVSVLFTDIYHFL